MDIEGASTVSLYFLRGIVKASIVLLGSSSLHSLSTFFSHTPAYYPYKSTVNNRKDYDAL